MYSETSTTPTSPARNAVAVPPVERTPKPRFFKRCANSTIPVASVVQQIELGPLQTIDVLVPSGVLPGQILQVQTPKGIVQLQIQPGMEPGTTVQVHI